MLRALRDSGGDSSCETRKAPPAERAFDGASAEWHDRKWIHVGNDSTSRGCRADMLVVARWWRRVAKSCPSSFSPFSHSSGMVPAEWSTCCDVGGLGMLRVSSCLDFWGRNPRLRPSRRTGPISRLPVSTAPAHGATTSSRGCGRRRRSTRSMAGASPSWSGIAPPRCEPGPCLRGHPRPRSSRRLGRHGSAAERGKTQPQRSVSLVLHPTTE